MSNGEGGEDFCVAQRGRRADSTTWGGGAASSGEHFCPSTVYLQYNLALLLFANITPMPIRHKLAADVAQCSASRASSKLIPV
jgi:hypothetical protein